MPGPVEATSSTLEVAHDDRVYNINSICIRNMNYKLIFMPHKGNQTMIVPAADAALAVAYSPA